MELNDWAPPERLATWVGEVTESLLGCVGDFGGDDDERWMGPYLDIVNPPIWEIAHVAWFAEWFVLRQMHGRRPLMADVDARYDSAAVPHLTRWHLDYPTVADTKGYVRAVGEALAEVTLDDGGLDSTSALVVYAITHYDAHIEALTYTRQTLEWGAAVDGAEPPQDGGSAADPRWGASADLPVGGGRFIMGASRDQPFVVDNERWGYRAEVEPFEMAAAPVTVAQFGAFVDDGGYERPSLWSNEGWAWRSGAAADAPVYWRRGTDGWERRLLDTWHPVEATADHPMVHVSWWEAEAYCAWAQRRLPTEAEWEFAATSGPDRPREPWFPWGWRDPRAEEAALDRRTRTTVPVSAHAAGDGPWGHRQLIGNVWEWTESDFEPYPHFEQDSYRDNSWPWFGSRKVLRGGSWATTNRYMRSTFRNYFTPDRRDVVAGFRTCPPR